MLKIENISYRIGGKTIFKNSTATIPPGHKVGVVGRNGIGKSTLFTLLKDEIQIESGNITIPKKSRIGSMDQEVPGTEKNLIETVLEYDIERDLLLKEAKLATNPTRVSEIHLRLADIDSHTAEPRASSILKGLGFGNESQLRPTKSFSGGWRMRVALAGLLFSKPDILLLDEPTNFLDLEGVFWLEKFLYKYPHTVLIISHDRALLNKAVNSILHVNNETLKLYSGNFDLFDEQRREELRHQLAAAKKQEDRKKHMQSYVDRFRYQANKAKQAQSRIKMIEKMQPIAVEDANRSVRFSFPNPEELSPPLISMEEVKVGYGSEVILKNINLRLDQDDRIALIGANGEGKSTFAKLLSGQLVPFSGNFNVQNKLRIGFFAQHQIEDLTPSETPLDHLKSALSKESPSNLRSKLASFGINSEIADNNVDSLSGGQKARLSLLLATLSAPHILILDEPTNHLDMESREALIRALADYSGAVIIVSHDLNILSLTANKLWLVKNQEVREYHEDLNSYRDMLLKERGGSKEKENKSRVKASVKKNSPKQSVKEEEVARCGQRIEKIENIIKIIDENLSNPLIYEQYNDDKLRKLQKQRKEAIEALKRAEMLWEKAINLM
ncbi:MAG: glycosyl transferase family 1 [Rhodobacteraceae bacterium]|nr:glycosyl transferase family 1 [Paracoccaceae bacterium]